MHILLASPHLLPAFAYGGTERVVVSLAVALVELGHRVTVVAPEGSTSFDPRVELVIKRRATWAEVINRVVGIDVVHLNMQPDGALERPYVTTQHGNSGLGESLDLNTLFVSQEQAARYGSGCFVYNGLDWRAYGTPDLSNDRRYLHFLAKAAWRVKNVKGAIDVARRAGQQMVVAGGTRFNIKMGFRFTPWPSIRFAGMVGGAKKIQILQGSRGLLFPVRWSEPFGLAITESMYFGCPVFGTPYGSLPELVGGEYGFLSAQSGELVEAAKDWQRYDRKALHAYALEKFDAATMAKAYLACYERVLAGELLHQERPSLLVAPEKFLPFA